MRGGAAPVGGLLALAAVLLCAGPAAAQLRGLELRVDNDQFAITPAGDERWYTSGVYLGVTVAAAADAPDARLAAAGCRLLACGTDLRHLRLLTLGHALYTPRSPGTDVPQPFDRPYAATLHAGWAAVAHGAQARQTLELRLGTVGPAALGEEVQNTLHRLIQQGRAVGWGWQVRAQPLVELGASRLQRVALPLDGWDAVVRTAAQVGNPVTQATLGASLRFGVPPAAPTWPGESAIGVPSGGWHLLAGAELRAVARNTLIDGRTYAYASQVRREPLVTEGFVGARWAPLPEWSVDFTVVLRSVEFDAPLEPVPRRPQRYGMLVLRWQAPP